MLFSVIVPVYNRPNEVRELLQSLSAQTDNRFEVLIIEDGSTVKSEDVCKQFAQGKLNIHYFYKENTGPGDSRNFGALKASGEYLIILDSDCVVPEHYIENVRKELTVHHCDAFGGADAAHESFSAMQKAVNYAMTSFLTTGGIRGGRKEGLEKFHPRSFNMGVKSDVYRALGGFSNMRYGEDIDFSIRLFEAGYSVRLFNDAYVYHKRRTNLKKFFMQVFHSGEARIVLWRKHPNSFRLVHVLPSCFVVGSVSSLLLGFFAPAFWVVLPVFCTAILVESTFKNRSLGIGFLSIITSLTQLYGYGSGVIKEITRTKTRTRDNALPEPPATRTVQQ